jgi:hypothetical protein
MNSTARASTATPRPLRPDESNHPALDDDILNEGRETPSSNAATAPPRHDPNAVKHFSLHLKSGLWELHGLDGVPAAHYDTKDAALAAVIRSITSEPRAVKIYAEDGTLEEERTYPRSAAPEPPPA